MGNERDDQYAPYFSYLMWLGVVSISCPTLIKHVGVPTAGSVSTTTGIRPGYFASYRAWHSQPVIVHMGMLFAQVCK